MKKTILVLLAMVASVCEAGNFERVLLGGTVDHSQIWSSSGDSIYHELGGTGFRTTSFTAPSNGMVEVTACLHIRSGDSSGHSRLYNKFYLEVFDPSTTPSSTASSPPSSNVSLDRESLWESTDGYGDPIHYFDASGCWSDAFPVVASTSYKFRVMVMCGQTIHCEVSYGSTLIRRFWSD